MLLFRLDFFIWYSEYDELVCGLYSDFIHGDIWTCSEDNHQYAILWLPRQLQGHMFLQYYGIIISMFIWKIMQGLKIFKKWKFDNHIWDNGVRDSYSRGISCSSLIAHIWWILLSVMKLSSATANFIIMAFNLAKL